MTFLDWPHFVKPCLHAPPMAISVAFVAHHDEISFDCPFCGPVEIRVPAPHRRE